MLVESTCGEGPSCPRSPLRYTPTPEKIKNPPSTPALTWNSKIKHSFLSPGSFSLFYADMQMSWERLPLSSHIWPGKRPFPENRLCLRDAWEMTWECRGGGKRRQRQLEGMRGLLHPIDSTQPGQRGELKTEPSETAPPPRTLNNCYKTQIQFTYRKTRTCKMHNLLIFSTFTRWHNIITL